MVIIVSLHLLLAVGFMLYFFHVPGNTDIHHKNVTVTVAPASNETKLDSAASVVNKPEGDSLEEDEEDNSSSEKKSAPDTGGAGGGGTGKVEAPTVQVKREESPDQAPASDSKVQKGETPITEDSAEEG